MSVTATDGKLHQGTLKEVTDSAITLRSLSTEVSLPKADLSRVDYIREKPLSDAGEYRWHELGPFMVFDPELYARMFHLGEIMEVRLYDSAVPEEDLSARCK